MGGGGATAIGGGSGSGVLGAGAVFTADTTISLGSGLAGHFTYAGLNAAMAGGPTASATSAALAGSSTATGASALASLGTSLAIGGAVAAGVILVILASKYQKKKIEKLKQRNEETKRPNIRRLDFEVAQLRSQQKAISNGIKKRLSSDIRVVASPFMPVPLDVGKRAVHRVTKGETISKIAKRYGVSLDAIIQSNNLLSGDPNSTYLADVLHVNRVNQNVRQAIIESGIAQAYGAVPNKEATLQFIRNELRSFPTNENGRKERKK